MTFNELVDHYRNPATGEHDYINCSVSVGVTQTTFYKWRRANVIPPRQQLAIETITRGELKADLSAYPMHARR